MLVAMMGMITTTDGELLYSRPETMGEQLWFGSHEDMTKTQNEAPQEDIKRIDQLTWIINQRVFSHETNIELSNAYLEELMCSDEISSWKSQREFGHGWDQVMSLSHSNRSPQASSRLFYTICPQQPSCSSPIIHPSKSGLPIPCLSVPFPIPCTL